MVPSAASGFQCLKRDFLFQKRNRTMKHPLPTITNASPDDVMDIIALQRQSWLDTYPNDVVGVSREWVQARVDSWTDLNKLARRIGKVEQAQNDPDLLYRVAKDDAGKIVGLSIAIRDDDTQVVGTIHVKKSYYGTGLAQRLMDEIIGWADETRPLELEVASYNERAKAFYRKYGFKEVKGSEALYGDVIPVVTMIRKGVGDV
jgi:ribosomal protein S18 acetylase RimI-like enzyme